MRTVRSVNKLHVGNLGPSGIGEDSVEIPVDVNTKTMNMYIQEKKNLTTLFFYWHEIVVLSQKWGMLQVSPKFWQSLPYTGRSQVIDIYPIYTSNISHLITQNHDPIILGLNPTHSHQHNTSYSITSYNCSSNKRFNFNYKHAWSKRY